jgi:hypothetical protein
MLFDDVMLLLNNDVGGIERGAATVRAALGAKRVFLGLEMLRHRLASRWLCPRFGLFGRSHLRWRLRALIEGLSVFGSDFGCNLRWLLHRRFTMTSLRNGE